MSGLVTGMVYGRTLVKSGRTALRHRALRRARDLYLAHLCLTPLLFSRPLGRFVHCSALLFFVDSLVARRNLDLPAQLVRHSAHVLVFLLLVPS